MSVLHRLASVNFHKALGIMQKVEQIVAYACL